MDIRNNYQKIKKIDSMSKNKDNVKILFLGYHDVNNLGDPAIAQCTEWLFTHNLSIPFDIKRVNLYFMKKHYVNSYFRRLRSEERRVGKECRFNSCCWWGGDKI